MLEVRSCPAVPEQAIRRVLSIEVGDLLGVGEDANAADRLSLRCSGEEVLIEAAGWDGTRPLARSFRLDDFPGDAAPRALALAGLELLAARSPAVRRRMQERQSTPSPSPALPAPEPRAVARSRQLDLGLAASWRSFLVGQGASVWGGSAAAHLWMSPWQLAADLDAAVGSTSVKLGEVTATLLSAAASVGMAGRFGPIDAGLGIGGRVGIARLAGMGDEAARAVASTVWRPWGGPMARATASATLGHLGLQAAAEVGRSLSSAEGLAGGVRAVALAGWWLGLSMGIAVRP